MTKYSHEDIEFCTPEEIRDYQNGKLREALNYLNEHSPFYQRMFRENGIDLESIKTVDDLVKIPFTLKFAANPFARTDLIVTRACEASD